MELTIEQALQQGVAAHKEGKLQDAEYFYRAVLQSEPGHPDVNHNLGLIAVSANKTAFFDLFFYSIWIVMKTSKCHYYYIIMRKKKRNSNFVLFLKCIYYSFRYNHQVYLIHWIQLFCSIQM